QHSLVALADLQHAAHLLAGQALDIAERHDLPLAVWQVPDRRAEEAGQLAGLEAVLHILDPVLRRRSPAAAAVDRGRRHGRLGAAHRAGVAALVEPWAAARYAMGDFRSSALLPVRGRTSVMAARARGRGSRRLSVGSAG